MSKSAGQIVGGAIGAVVGYFAGGNVALGWQIGPAVGSTNSMMETSAEIEQLEEVTFE